MSQDPRSLADAAEHLARTLGIASPQVIALIERSWEEVMGDIAPLCRFVGVVDRVLVIETAIPAVAERAQLRRKELQQRYGDLVGSDRVRDVTVRVRPKGQTNSE